MKKLILTANIFLLILITSVIAQQDTSNTPTMDPKAATYFNNAVQNLQNQKYEVVVAYADSSLQIAKDYKTYMLKGDALIKLNKYAEAKDAFNASLMLNKNEAAYNRLANSQLLLKEYDDAIATYEKVLQMSQNAEMKKKAQESIAFVKNTKAIEFFNKGNELSKENKFDEAIKNYNMALSINDKDARTYYQKGLTLSKMNKEDEAESVLKKATETDNSFDLAYIALAGLQTKKGAYDNAVKSYEKVIEVSKNENLKAAAKEGIGRTYIVVGNADYKAKKYDKSIEDFNKSIANGSSESAYLGLAKSFIEKKQYENALKSLDSVVVYKKMITDGAINYYKGLIYFNKGDNKKAVEFFTAGLTDATYKKACQSQIDFIKAKEKGAKPK
ncbi:MAG: tetratricopeptide repeat protein [Ignavibacteriales bacterium]|nr:tetratricopeptide repeat protein [Ignavibacteriales bacterium]